MERDLKIIPALDQIVIEIRNKNEGGILVPEWFTVTIKFGLTTS
jgi:hypothetical protein